jgi:hypothetical protein
MTTTAYRNANLPITNHRFVIGSPLSLSLRPGVLSETQSACIMAFAIDLPASARRHLAAADALANSGHHSVAGYLYGLAAECAVKAMMREAGLLPDASVSRRDDPFFVHFPELRTMLRDRLQRRGGTPLTRLIEDDDFMNNWCTRMRYSHGRDIRRTWIDKWAKQARQAVEYIGT